jgi:hypothetical protein
MSDELHKYPGNLKHHKVDKEGQRKLLCEMMEDDDNSGLYDMAKRPPLLSDDALVELTYVKEDGRRPSEQVRDIYEEARAKDAELIQRLVDGLQQIADEGHWTPDMDELLNVSAAAGFKPTQAE